MPIYRYSCTACATSITKFRKKSDQIDPTCPGCTAPMVRNMGTPDAIAKETTDDYRGKSRFQDTEAKRNERAEEHFRRVELPKLIEKEGIDFCIRQGFVDPDTKIK